MENLAVIIPDKIPSTVSKGVQRAFLGLQKLPDDCIVYYEPLIDRRRPDFLILSPDLGLIAIEIRNWYPGMITGVSDEEVLIRDGEPSNQVHPLYHVTQYLSVLSRRIADKPCFSSLLSGEGENGSCIPVFPIRYALLLPNCTIPQLENHQLGDLHRFFSPDHTLCREMLVEIERWESDELIPFLRSLPPIHGEGFTLSPMQVQLLRAVIHPDIVIDSSPIRQMYDQTGSIRLNTLDYLQEKSLYQIRQGHQIISGDAGSGKTTILAARARILHHNPESRILVLCSNTVLSEQLKRSLSGYSRIHVSSFREWAAENGTGCSGSEEEIESDQDLGLRLLEKMKEPGRDFPVYDAVLVDEAQDFAPSWIRCAKEALRDPETGDLLIVSDGQQGRYGLAGISWKELGIHAKGRISHQASDLGKNYRNTQEIQALARMFLSPVPGISPATISFPVNEAKPERSGLKPLLVWNTSHANQGDYATFLVRRLLGSLKSAQHLAGLRPEDIAILYPHAAEQDRRILSRMVSELGRFCPVQWVSENHHTHSRIHLPGVKVHDARSIKGMQYRAVMVLFSEYFDTYLTDPLHSDDRHLLYVALTRPADFLTIQYTEKTGLIRKILSSGNVDEFIGK